MDAGDLVKQVFRQLSFFGQITQDRLFLLMGQRAQASAPPDIVRRPGPSNDVMALPGLSLIHI